MVIPSVNILLLFYPFLDGTQLHTNYDESLLLNIYKSYVISTF